MITYRDIKTTLTEKKDHGYLASFKQNEPRHDKTCFFPYANNKGADQPGPRQANLVLIAYASSESRGTFRQKARSLVPLNGWACAVKICHDGMLEDTNSLDGAQPVHPCNLISAFFVRCLDSKIPIRATANISRL